MMLEYICGHRLRITVSHNHSCIFSAAMQNTTFIQLKSSSHRPLNYTSLGQEIAFLFRPFKEQWPATWHFHCWKKKNAGKIRQTIDIKMGALNLVIAGIGFKPPTPRNPEMVK